MKSIRMSKKNLQKIKKWTPPMDQEANQKSHLLQPHTHGDEYQLQSVIDAFQEGLRVLDLDLIIRVQNQAARQWAGERKEVGLPCYQIHYDRQEPCENCHVLKAINTGQLVKKGEYYQEKEGKQRTFELFASPLRDEKGNITGVLEYFQDVTDYLSQEEALKHAESRYESILDATNTGVWEYDSKRQMERLSNTYFTYLGYEPSDYMDEQGFTSPSFFSSIIHPEDREAEMDGFNQYIDDGSPGIYENRFRIRKKDGSWAWMLSKGKTLRDRQGNPTHITLGTMTDITSQQLAHLYRELGWKVLQIFNQKWDMDTSLKRVSEVIREDTGFEVVGIRLKKDEDFPFVVKTGAVELGGEEVNTLLIRDGEGKFLRDELGRPLLACTCGQVLSGQLPVDRPFTTSIGSFWTNHLEDDFNQEAQDFREMDFHNSCLHRQYASLALIPLRNKDDIVGLLYLADTRPGVLNREMVDLMEVVAAVLGEAVAHQTISQQLTEKERESSLLVSQMQLGLALHEIICDDHGIPVDYRFLSVNDSYERITGLRREDLIGRRVMEVLPNTEPYWIQRFCNVALTGISHEFEEYSVELEKYFQVKVYSPQPNQFAVIVDDVTEKRKATLALTQAKEAAEVANKAKTQFLANMSHELRTPLNGLMGMIQLLESTTLNEEQQEFVHIAMEGAQSLTQVVGDILNYTSLEKQKQATTEEAFQVEALLQEVIGLHQAAAVHKELVLRVNKDESLPEELVGDRFKLKQILGNLVGNAVKFTDSGEVELWARPASDESIDDLMMVSFDVKDTGIGIPSDKVDYIFQQFCQVDESHTRRHGGLGLGLAVAKEQAATLGGSLAVASTLGEGSVFTLTCQLGHRPASRISPRQFVPGDIYTKKDLPTPAKVLVVDDDYSSRLMIKLHLEKMGFAVDTANDGASALKMAKERDYKVVFMDCQMPVMDGYEAARNIRQVDKGKGHTTPIVAMTANVLPGDQEKCMEAGMDGFLAKPLEINRLKEMMVKFA